MIPKPYYDEDGITIYHADCADVFPFVEPPEVALLLTDPPYGIGWYTGSDRRKVRGQLHGATPPSRRHPPIVNDNAKFDPRPLLAYQRLALFGAQHFADRLPASPGWIVWDKSLGLNDSHQGDADLIWTNFLGATRVFRHLWKGVLRDSEQTDVRSHPTMKPVALMRWILNKWTEPGDLVLDPYMGSGPIAQACKELGRRYIGVEIVEEYCQAAAQRLAQEVFALSGPVAGGVL